MQLPIEEQDCRIRQKYEIKRSFSKFTANKRHGEDDDPTKTVNL